MTIQAGWRRIIDNSGGSAASVAARHVFRALSLPFWAGAEGKNILYDRGFRSIIRTPSRVISIGNLSMGGTGKTPLTLSLARYYKNVGVSVVILSRGYGGAVGKRWFVVSNGKDILYNAAQVGDEPILLARLSGLPVVVCKDRVKGARIALREFGARVILLDDGFQHRRLARDLDIVLLDAQRPLNNEWVFPRGMLREPVSSLKRAHVCILTRYDGSSRALKNLTVLQKRFPHLQVFTGAHQPDSIVDKGREIEPGGISQKRVVVFSGLADNDQFLATVHDLGAKVTYFKPFSDHHHYDKRDIDLLLHARQTTNADGFLTTEKDFVKVKSFIRADFNPWTLRIRFQILKNEKAFFRTILNAAG